MLEISSTHTHHLFLSYIWFLKDLKVCKTWKVQSSRRGVKRVESPTAPFIVKPHLCPTHTHFSMFPCHLNRVYGVKRLIAILHLIYKECRTLVNWLQILKNAHTQKYVHFNFKISLYKMVSNEGDFKPKFLKEMLGTKQLQGSNHHLYLTSLSMQQQNFI